MKTMPRYWSLAGLVLTAGLLLVVGCSSSQPPEDRPGRPVVEEKAPPDALELVFTYGSEKEAWIKEVTASFNAGLTKLPNGKPIFVRQYPMGSGDCTDEVLSGRRQTHLISPASAAFIEIGNAESRVKTGQDLVASAGDNLVLSPVVVAMWKPMAESLGWPEKRVGWSDILALAKDPQGWAARGHPEWGTFKFGHTHPDYSNSGLISLFAEVYAGAGKVNGLTVADVREPKVAEYLAGIEKSVVHYGTSTGFFGTKLFSNGPKYLSAAVLYENMVIDSYGQKYQLPFPVVAIYPKEGTFWSDHPAAIVQRDWVTPDHREAAKLFIKYLLDKPQQEKALAHGFRPADVNVPLSAPVDAAHGVNPKEPATTLQVPHADVIEAIKQLWRTNKKPAHLVLVFDTSGSMSEDNKMESARVGAVELVKMLNDGDQLSLLPFDNALKWTTRAVPLKIGREDAIRRIQSFYPDGGTALYDAIAAAHAELQKDVKPDHIAAVVVLTDGADTHSRMKLTELLQHISANPEKPSVRVFTIGYGEDAQGDILKKIAEVTQSKYYQGKPQNIREVFKEIATFF